MREWRKPFIKDGVAEFWRGIKNGLDLNELRLDWIEIGFFEIESAESAEVEGQLPWVLVRN